MRHIKHLSLILIAVLLVIFTVLAQNAISNNYNFQSSSSNSQAAGSVVYIENGVSGTVSITDPFLNKTTTVSVEYAPLDSGSGFIVNKNGYIITAFHVIGDPASLLNNDTLKLMNSTDVQNYVENAAVAGYITNYNPQLGSELSTNTLPGNPMVIQNQPNINTTTAQLVQRNLITVQSSKQQIMVNLPGSLSGNSINANLVDVGDANQDQDIALLKISTSFQSLSPLSISSKTPQNGEKIQIYGYPISNSTMYSGFSQSVINPSSSSGILTNIVPDNSTVYYQTSAIATHGYSGGPAVNSQNSVLGIVIYSIESSSQPNNVTSTLFLSSNYIIQICRKNNVPINEV